MRNEKYFLNEEGLIEIFNEYNANEAVVSFTEEEFQIFKQDLERFKDISTGTFIFLNIDLKLEQVLYCYSYEEFEIYLSNNNRKNDCLFVFSPEQIQLTLNSFKTL